LLPDPNPEIYPVEAAGKKPAFRIGKGKHNTTNGVSSHVPSCMAN